VGLERLRALAQRHTDVERLCAAVVEHLVPEAPTDDIAFIAARVPPLPDRLDTTWPATLDSLSEARHLLRRWLRTHGAGERETYDIVVASQEACANAVEHAYGPGRATFDLEAQAEGGRVRIVVRDRGRWREPRGSDRGRGLPIMRAVMDEVEVRQADDGTEVILTRTLRREP
jgi:anti-sigma regulatory factor (Ser/Thr protein kinase)